MKQTATNILIIEDEIDIRESLEDLLELHGYRTIGAPDGANGVAAAITYRPDLILCDVMMPDIDGFETVEMLRKQEGLKNVPIIFLTALTDIQDHRKGMSCGADDYLYKPFDVKSLLAAIRTRLDRAEAVKLEMSKRSANLRRQIRDLEEMMSQYAHLNSHALRGPLTRLLGLTRLLLDGSDLGDEWVRNDILMAIEQSTLEMDEIIHFMNQALNQSSDSEGKV